MNGAYVDLEVFEGPLDLLLHLVKKHEINLRDIPIAFVAQKYLEYLDTRSAPDLDADSRWLVMAADLVNLKVACSSTRMRPTKTTGQTPGKACDHARMEADVSGRLVPHGRDGRRVWPDD